ncbi:MAG: hypothetical protein QM764_21045 [Chitinophagaceae bacterium]
MQTNLIRRSEALSPYLLFLPFLVLYSGIILKFHSGQIADDEIRYTGYAQNLLNGFYSNPPPNVSIINGPGYPIILMPFVAGKAPLLWMALINAAFYYLSVVFLFKSLKKISPFKIAFSFALFWACYYSSFQDMLHAFTESFTCLVISLILYFLTRVYIDDDSAAKRKYLYFSGISIGYLVLTKIIFGYVLLVMIIGSAVLWLINGHSVTIRKNLLILSVAFLTITPYLAYTYSLTGKIFYLGNPGADSFYWMSNPNQGEFGDWWGYPVKVAKDEPYLVPYYHDSLTTRHQTDFDNARRYDGPRQDSIFNKIASDNIKSHPGKFIENWISNIGRLLFSFPNSYTLQNNKTLFRLPLNGIVVILSLLCSIPTLLNWKKLNFMLKFLLFFTLIYLGGSSLVSGVTRMFTIIVPVFLFWFAFVLPRILTIKWRFTGD